MGLLNLILTLAMAAVFGWVGFMFLPPFGAAAALIPLYFGFSGGSTSCPRCGSTEIRQLNTGQLQCANCNYTEE